MQVERPRLFCSIIIHDTLREKGPSGDDGSICHGNVQLAFYECSCQCTCTTDIERIHYITPYILQTTHNKQKVTNGPFLMAGHAYPQFKEFTVHSYTHTHTHTHLCLDSVGSWACPFLVKLRPPLGQQVVLHCLH